MSQFEWTRVGITADDAEKLKGMPQPLVIKIPGIKIEENNEMEPAVEKRMRDYAHKKPDPKRQGIAIGIIIMLVALAICAIGVAAGSFLTRVLVL